MCKGTEQRVIFREGLGTKSSFPTLPNVAQNASPGLSTLTLAVSGQVLPPSTDIAFFSQSQGSKAFSLRYDAKRANKLIFSPIRSNNGAELS